MNSYRIIRPFAGRVGKSFFRTHAENRGPLLLGRDGLGCLRVPKTPNKHARSHIYPIYRDRVTMYRDRISRPVCVQPITVPTAFCTHARTTGMGNERFAYAQYRGSGV
jgi:hypothetical protein